MNPVTLLLRILCLTFATGALAPAQGDPLNGNPLTPAQDAALDAQIAIAQAAINRLAAGDPRKKQAQEALDALKEAKDGHKLPPGMMGPEAPPRVLTPPPGHRMNDAPCGGTSSETHDGQGNGSSTGAVGVGEEYVYLSTSNFTCDPAIGAGIALHEGQRLIEVGDRNPRQNAPGSGSPPTPSQRQNNLTCFQLNKIVVAHALTQVPATEPRHKVLKDRVEKFLDPYINRYGG